MSSYALRSSLIPGDRQPIHATENVNGIVASHTDLCKLRITSTRTRCASVPCAAVPLPTGNAYLYKYLVSKPCLVEISENLIGKEQQLVLQPTGRRTTMALPRPSEMSGTQQRSTRPTIVLMKVEGQRLCTNTRSCSNSRQVLGALCSIASRRTR